METLPLSDAFPYLGQTIAYKKQKLARCIPEPGEVVEVVGDDCKGSGEDGINSAVPEDDV